MTENVSVEFCGEKLDLHPDGASEFAILEFAEASQAEADSVEGIGAQLRLIESGLVDGARFRRLARKNRVTVQDLIPLVKAVMEAKTEHPTGLPSDSSDGPTPTPVSSESKPDAQVTDLFAGRPDLAFAAKQKEKALSA